MRRALAASAVIAGALLPWPGDASAHVGSPGVFLEGNAGPYRLFVSISPPIVVPGVADLEIRCAGPADAIAAVRITPLPLTGDGAKFAPVADVAERSPEDPRFFTGHLWMMSAGSWQVRIAVDGGRGHGELSVPVAALPARTNGMQLGFGALLFALMAVLAIGLVAIVGASVREATLAPCAAAPPERRRRALVAMAIAAAIVLGLLALGRAWWSAEDTKYGAYVYKPIELEARAIDGRLTLELRDPGWLPSRRLDDLVLDHGHRMHLFVIREPGLDRVWHLHPVSKSPGRFEIDLPTIEAGRYRLFADVVHETGLAETGVAAIDLPASEGHALEGDDAVGAAPPIDPPRFDRLDAPLADGGRLVWERGASPLEAKRPVQLRFRAEDAGGAPARGLGLYMGMLGHAAIVKSDFRVFAHVHPSGSVPMAAMMIANLGAHEGMAAGDPGPSTLTFPFGFPEPGAYRIFVQLMRSGRIETAAFDADVR
jgi:hypothetical protein